MKERPILFSGPMVQAILAGRKTQTRRLVKPAPTEDFLPVVGNYQRTLVDRKTGEMFPDPIVRFGASDENQDFPCRYGAPGDRLWVKETFNRTNPGGADGIYFYRADGKFPWGEPYAGIELWKPSIFCTRAASRITLEITAVRVERLQDITEADAQAEGVQAIHTNELQSDGTIKPVTITARRNFEDLWWRINGAGSWDANPWVWVISFRRITP